MFRIILAMILGFQVAAVFETAHAAQRLSASSNTSYPPRGKVIQCPVTRDTWVSSVGDEATGNNGGAGVLKVKGQQEYAIIDIDPAALKGKLIAGACLHVRSASPRKAPLARLGVSSLASRWAEGTASRYHPQRGSACYEQAMYRKKDWAYPGSTLMDVVFGKGNTVWKFADCTPPDRHHWQTCAVAPEVVAARVAGISHGFCLYDELGSTWSIKNGVFQYNYFPNRYFYSRESGESAPWLQVWVSGEDSVPPDPVTSVDCITAGMPPGQALLEWTTPQDRGGGRIIGFDVEYTLNGELRQVPRYLIPMAGRAGQKVRMHLQDLPLMPGQAVRVTIRPVDSAGNVGKPYSQVVHVSAGVKLPQFSVPRAVVFRAAAKPLEVGGLKVSVLHLLQKVNPVTGAILPVPGAADSVDDYLFSAQKRRIMLYAARNETVCFQLNLQGAAENIAVHMGFKGHSAIKTRLYQFAYVNVTESGGRECQLPDPLVPLRGPFSIPSTAGFVKVAGQKNHSLICELYVPHGESPGEKHGTVRISMGGKSLVLDIALRVWDFTLPDKLSFIPEMNAYSTVSPYHGYAYYRLAHEQRTCLNRLPYGWNGKPSFAPVWNGKTFDWSRWDKEVGPLLDGSAFKGLPRAGEPVAVLYLPFNENWPVKLAGNYKCSYWADEAFAKAYRTELQHAFAQFAQHCSAEKWHDTIFEFYLNGKVYYRKQFKGSSAPWIFDEPVDTQDFWALRWFGLAWQNAVRPYKGPVKLWFRGDISYSQFARNMLWGVMDVTYLGGNDAQKTRMEHDQQILFGRTYFSEYGSPNKISRPNTQPVLWCLSAWARGAMGVLPWQTIGSRNAWVTGEQTSLFYPLPSGPVPSVRLKAFTYGQELVEYLTLFARTYHLPRYAVAQWLEHRIDLRSAVRKRSTADAGTARFQPVSIAQLWRLRYLLGEMISKKAPPYRRSLVNFQSPIFDPARLPDIGYVTPAPPVPPVRPGCGG